MIYVLGGGSAALNFEILGGATQPSYPEENTIWVNTGSKITGWTIAPHAPVGTEGTVWIATGDSGPRSFNALKGNGLIIHPLYAKQYVGGAWVARKAKIYQGGEWCDWVLYVYRHGEFVQVSGFTMTNGSATNSGGKLTFKSSTTQVNYVLARTTAKVDLSGLETLVARFVDGSYSYRDASASTGVGFGVTVNTPAVNTSGWQPQMTNAVAWHIFAHTKDNGAEPVGELKLDVSTVGQPGYICFLGKPFYNEDYTPVHATLIVDEIRVE